jgi:hypothetical protein
LFISCITSRCRIYRPRGSENKTPTSNSHSRARIGGGQRRRQQQHQQHQRPRNGGADNPTRPRAPADIVQTPSPQPVQRARNKQKTNPTRPYAGAPATLHIGPSSHVYHAPRALLPATLLQCHGWIGPAAQAPDISLPDVDDDTAHTLLHYLHTGLYESLAARPSSALDEARGEFARALAAYAVAARYEISGLAALARREVLAWGEGLGVDHVVGLLEGRFAKVHDEEGGWLKEWVRGKCRAAFEADYGRFARMDVWDGVGDVVLYRWLMKCLVEMLSERVARLGGGEPAAHVGVEVAVNGTGAELVQTGNCSVAEGIAIEVLQVPTEPPTPVGELYLDEDSIVAAITDAPSVPRKPESGISYGAWDSRFEDRVPAAADDGETDLDFEALNAALAAQQLEEDSRTDTDAERGGCFASVTERKKKRKGKKVVFHEDALKAQKEMEMAVEAGVQQLEEEEAALDRLAEEAELVHLAEEAELLHIAEEAELAQLAEETELARLAEEAELARLNEEEVEAEAEPATEPESGSFREPRSESEPVQEQGAALETESIPEPELQQQEAVPEPSVIAEPSPTPENPFAGLTFKEKRKLAKKLKKEAAAEKEAAESAQAQTPQEQTSTTTSPALNPQRHPAPESPAPAPVNQFAGLDRLQKLKLLKKMVSGKKAKERDIQAAADAAGLEVQGEPMGYMFESLSRSQKRTLLNSLIDEAAEAERDEGSNGTHTPPAEQEDHGTTTTTAATAAPIDAISALTAASSTSARLLILRSLAATQPADEVSLATLFASGLEPDGNTRYLINMLYTEGFDRAQKLRLLDDLIQDAHSAEADADADAARQGVASYPTPDLSQEDTHAVSASPSPPQQPKQKKKKNKTKTPLTAAAAADTESESKPKPSKAKKQKPVIPPAPSPPLSSDSAAPGRGGMEGSWAEAMETFDEEAVEEEERGRKGKKGGSKKKKTKKGG